MNEQSHNLAAFEYRSPAAMRLAELRAVARDILDCRLILNRLVGGDTDHPDALWLAALILYRRAFNGGTRPGFSPEQVASLGSGALLLHERMLGDAQRGCSQSRIGYAETKIAAVVEGDAIRTIKVFPLKARKLENQIVQECSAMLEALAREIIAPQVASLEKSILQEVQTLGIQLVRHLPPVEPSLPLASAT